MLHPNYYIEKAKVDKLVSRKNVVSDIYNGIYERYEYPVLTREFAPVHWRYDLNPETNPYFMERLGINATLNSGAIYLNGKFYLVVRVEGNDRKSFFAVAESDTGIDGFHFWDYPVVLPDTCPEILDRSLGKGTANIAAGPAMPRPAAVQGILTGMELAAQARQDGIRLLGVGEMGIGNTTTSSAVLCALSGEPVEAVTGRGGGLTDAAFGRKKQVIEQALAVNRPDADDPIDVLCKVGGFDLCAMTGVFLGAAHARLPVVVDGFISIVAALCAARLCENARGFFFGSHVSYERGYKVAEQLLGLQPCLQLGMRLGEGSGCPLAFRVIEAACAVISTMATFPEAAIDDTYLTEIREKDSFTV